MQTCQLEVKLNPHVQHNVVVNINLVIDILELLEGTARYAGPLLPPLDDFGLF